MKRLTLLLFIIAGGMYADSAVTIPDGKVGVKLSYQIKIEGGISPYTFEVKSGALPPGLSLDGNSGLIAGTPSGTQREPYSFAIAIHDNEQPSQELDQTFALKIAPVPMRVVSGVTSMRVVTEDAPTADIAKASLPAEAINPFVTAAPAPVPQDAPPGQNPPPQPPQTVAGQTTAKTKTSTAPKNPAAWAISPTTAEVCVGSSLKLFATGGSGATAAAQTTWKVDDNSATVNPDMGGSTVLTVNRQPSSDREFTVTATAGSATDTVTVVVPDNCAGFAGKEEVVRANLGFEQVGASGTSSGQNFLFDFFISRPTFNRIVRWWGDVKVASFPQQVNTSLVTFEPQFASTFGGLKVNQLAENAEFLTGPEFLITPNASRFQLTLFAGGGAIGPNNPTDSATVFTIPATGTAAYTTFTNQFGAPPSGSAITTAPKNVAFLPQSSDRFERQWQGGVRLYTFYNNNANGPVKPATVEFSIGQNEFVTNGHLTGLVGHVAATYPFTFTTGSSAVTVYFFGEATTAYTHATYAPAIPLAPALSNGSPVPLTDPSVYTITVPSNHRDTYRIGVGMDLITVVNSLFKSSQK
jgi:hypothetical protein